ncbi:MAG: cytidylate kinase-like family protein [Lachnospiraceae bacterium]|nr:cytidylate kinase-like family protein [Lachnospiraceae bacterium]
MRRLITIGREFGAGGGEIGRRVARELGLEYYDKDIILKTAVAGKNLDPGQVRKWDERVPKNFGFAQSLFDFYNKPLEEELWQAQRDAIRELANKESCVIVGRNGDYILREFDHCLRVFIHAGFDWRVKRMTAMMDQVPPEQVAGDVRAVDKARKRYCEYYTKQAYGDARNYDLTLDTEKLGIDMAVELILKAAETL